MISWTKLLTGKTQDHDNLRYSSHNGHTPRIVVWNTTSVCNLSCRHCYFDAKQTADPNELGIKEARAFIEDLAEFKVPVLLFSGGEPLLRKDIFELGEFTKDIGIRAVLSTNGTLITQDVAKKIIRAGFSYVGISLDGIEKNNDYFRRKKGAFTRALTGIKNCQNSGLKVGLRFTVTRYNFKDLPAIFNLVERQNISRLCIYHLVYTGRGSELTNQDLSHQERREILEFIWQKVYEFYRKKLNIEVLTVDNHADGVWIYLKLKKKNSKRAEKVLELLKVQGGNSSGMKIGAVDNYGNIYADQFLRTHPLGNIHNEKFSEVWQDKDNKFLQDLRNRKIFINGRCQKCSFLRICNGNFRARAEAAFGDPWAEDPACYLTEQEISEKCQ